VGHTSIAAIYYYPHAFNGQTGFGNAGSQHNLAASGWGRTKSCILLFGGQFAM
jgi:hypothetical protein